MIAQAYLPRDLTSLKKFGHLQRWMIIQKRQSMQKIIKHKNVNLAKTMILKYRLTEKAKTIFRIPPVVIFRENRLPRLIEVKTDREWT